MKCAIQQVWKPLLRRCGVRYRNPNGIQRWNGTMTYRAIALVTPLALLIASFGHAQNSQFLFDANGNLTVQMAGTILPPEIIGQPQIQVVGTNELAAFSVVVADPRSVTYQWRFDGSAINGQTGSSLQLDNVTAGDQGAYQVVLTNPSGSVTSAPAMLWIDNDGDGLGDSWELTHFGTLNRNSTGDSDGDRLSNHREFLDGSDPSDPNSARYRLLVIREGGTVIKNPDQTSYNKGQSVALTVTAGPNELFHAWLGDVVTRDNPVTLVMTNDKTVYARFTPIGFVWTNVANGNWETASNWSPNLVPGVNDSVLFNSNVTVTLNTFADCSDVTLGSVFATLTGSGTLAVRRNLFWTAGTMSGSGRTILESNAIVNIQNAVTLHTRTLENHGTILWSGSLLPVLGGAVITNAPGGSFQAESPLEAFLGGGIANGRFDNAGEFRKVANSGPLTLSSGLRFNNSGTVAIEANLLLSGDRFTNNGAIILAPGTTNRFAAGGSGNGTFSVPPTALVEWTGGTFTLDSGAQLNGDGLYRISSPAAVAANASFAVSNLDLTAGTLGGTGTVTIANVMNWTGGGMSGGGRTIIPTGAMLNAALPSGGGLNARTLENAGAVVWTGAGNIGFVSSVITNRAGALFEAKGAGGIAFVSGPNRFDNAGLFRKTLNAGTLDISGLGSFNNFSTVEIQTGTFQCGVGFTNFGVVQLSGATTNRLAGGGSATGTFETPATALMEWTGRSFALNPGAQLNGPGLYRINGTSANVAVNGDVSIQNFDLVNGDSALSALSGGGNLTILNAMNWTGGAMSGTGRTIVSPVATLSLANANFIGLQRVLENAGTTLWSGSGIIGMLNGVITNRAGAVFQALNSSRIAFSGGTCRFDNAGTFRKLGAGGTTTIDAGLPFSNAGTVDIRSGILAANGGFISTSNALLNVALGGTQAGTNHGQLRTSGTITLNGGLSVDLLPGYTPALNDTFAVLTAGTRNGTFNKFSYPSNVVSMQLSNTPTAVLLGVTNITPPPETTPTLNVQIQAGQFQICWPTSSNATYRVEFNVDLNSTNWTALSGNISATNSTTCFTDSLGVSNRFYRVRLSP